MSRSIHAPSLRGLALILAGVASLLGCATKRDEPMLVASEPTPILEPPGIEPRVVSSPETEVRPAAVRLLERTRFTLTIQDGDLRSVLLGIGRDSPLNVVVAPDVVGRVTADLKDVSLLDILDQIVLPRGYHYEVRGNLVRVFRSELQTRTYRVDYPNYRREGSSDLTIVGAIASRPDVGTSSGDSSDEDTSSAGVQTTQTVDFWGELEATMRSIVLGAADAENDRTANEEERGATEPLQHRRVLVSRQSGLVSVTAPRGTIAEVERYLEDLSQAAGRQVLIDAQILEITLGDDLDLGIDLEVAPGLPGSAQGAVGRSIGSSLPGFPGFKPATVAQALTPTFTEGEFAIGFAHDRIAAILRALATQTDLRVLSTPRITTLNNHKALIKVVRNQVFFIAEVESQVVEGVGVTQTTEFVPQIIPVGVTLDVTPHISDSGEITMHIHPSVSEVVDVELQPSSAAGQPQLGSLPVIDLRETDTVLRVPDGKTIVIGGLVQSREYTLERKVPFLGDLPALGRLFRSTSAEERRSELVILLTPTLMEPARIVRITDEAMQAVDAIESLRSQRSLEPPWWRRPIGQPYGARP